MTPKTYQDNFHKAHEDDSYKSANELIPCFLKYFSPNSVLDIGCGIGTWLKVFVKNSIHDVLGIDGDYVILNDLVIDKSKFLPKDLNKKVNLNRKFDLVISLEVAEHILPENANTFIETLCLHSNLILFSAAVPGQEGTMHFNEQLNDYWIKIFDKSGYVCYDFLRHEIWNNSKISYWYRQNTLLFLNKSELKNPVYKKITDKEISTCLNTYIHPDLFRYKTQKADRFYTLLNNPNQLILYYVKKIKNRLGL